MHVGDGGEYSIQQLNGEEHTPTLLYILDRYVSLSSSPILEYVVGSPSLSRIIYAVLEVPRSNSHGVRILSAV